MKGILLEASKDYKSFHRILQPATRGCEGFYDLVNQPIPMRLLHLSTAVPEQKLSTKALLTRFPCDLPEDVKRNIHHLGVSSRHLIEHGDLRAKSEAMMREESVLRLCSKACTRVVEDAGFSLKELDYLITTYDASPILCPGLSQPLARRLGFEPYIKQVNIQGVACTAFSKALELAEDHLARNPNDHVLICISGVNSYWFYNQVRGLKRVLEMGQIKTVKDVEQRQREMRKWIATIEFFLFGDGVASLIVAREGRGLSLDKKVEVVNLKDGDHLAGYTQLSTLVEPFTFGFWPHLAKEIPTLGLQYVQVVLQRLFGGAMLQSMRDVKKLAVHTGSKKILELITANYQIPPGKLRESFHVLDRYGNLAGASLPFILHEITSKKGLTEGDRLLSVGYGWGFAASACSFTFKNQVPFHMNQT